MEITYRRFVPSEAESEDLVGFLTGDTWPFHGAAVVDREQARRWISDGRYDGDENRAFWITAGDHVVGLVRLMDLGDSTPVFDLRIRSRHRGQGVGGHALAWLTAYLFTEFPGIRRIEGTTRQDNLAMRRTFRRCGYVKEAHYREAWPSAGGTVHDAVGYAVLRRDWLTGAATAPAWDDEHLA
ncbi:GNAT family N-acetyltransferase [Streptomyces sp. MB09-01]|uniref:GNAT family N-acetyltransferase n=1 Tax=Streptomyces sp. MB09-01 TaxID=3028666 RepID=UPI0029A26BC6|nr:GNAT family N-acetyltransferase [Streptomyces sp. MB09-01]MDX3540667.1 GNAT family N-acetyltransferase [Streptomyces sp. MB09-01]